MYIYIYIYIYICTHDIEEKHTHFSRVLSVPLISTYEFENRHKLQELKLYSLYCFLGYLVLL